MTNETIIIERIKDFQMEYPDGVPLNILKMDLGISVEELQKNLLTLEEQEILFIENEEYVKLVESTDGETMELDETLTENGSSKITDEPVIENAITYDLTEKEMKALEIIKEITDESGHIPKYILEGSLLYGELKLSTLGVYNMIMSLENKGIIKKITIKDSEYYAI
ncbi:MAG: hypothetical protein ACP5OJ_01740 [Methanothermobacter sp.]